MGSRSEIIPTMTSQSTDFDDVYPKLKNVLKNFGAGDTGVMDAFKWLEKALNYNVKLGKKSRGLEVVKSLRLLVESPSKRQIEIAYVLGWCVDMLQAYFFILADYMKQRSVNHQGKQCWHLVDNIDAISVNDAGFIKSGIYCLLKRYIGEEVYYRLVVELFQEATLNGMVGQRLEFNMLQGSNTDFSQFTMDRYRVLTEHMRSYQAFYLPVGLALHMAGIDDTASHTRAQQIMNKVGELIQIQDEFESFFGGTLATVQGIQDKNCTWVIVKALEKATEEQREELQLWYGQNDDQCKRKVMDIYNTLRLQDDIKHNEEKTLKEIEQLIDYNSVNLPKSLFKAILNDHFAGTKLIMD